MKYIEIKNIIDEIDERLHLLVTPKKELEWMVAIEENNYDEDHIIYNALMSVDNLIHYYRELRNRYLDLLEELEK